MNNDPVNYVDLWGLTASDAKTGTVESKPITKSSPFYKWTYVPMEGIGANGGSNFHQYSVLTDKELSIFAEGSFVASNLVNSYILCGDATLIVDGKTVGIESFVYPNYNFIHDGSYEKVIGDAIFNYDFSKATSVLADLKFDIIIQDYGGSVSSTYSKERIILK